MPLPVISGLLLLAEATSMEGLLNDGDPIAQWNDQSVNLNHLTQASAPSRPTFEADAGLGWPAMRTGPAGPQWLNIPMIFGDSAEVFVVFNVVNCPAIASGPGSNENAIWHMGDPTVDVGVNAASVIAWVDGNTYENFGGMRVTVLTGSCPAAGSPHIFGAAVEGTGGAGFTKYTYLNGVAHSPTGSRFVSSPSAPAWGSEMRLGAGIILGVYGEAQFYAVVAYNRKLDDTERAEVVDYLGMYLVARTTTPPPGGGIGFPGAPTVPVVTGPKTFQLLTGPTAGAALAAFDGVSSGRLEFRVDNSDRGELIVDEEALWLEQVDRDMVLRITDHNGRTTEWRIDQITDSDEGDGLAHLTLQPIYRDLGRVKVRRETVGGAVELQVTVAELSCEEIYDQVLAPLMPTWVSKGTFHSTQKLTTTQAWSIQEWVDWMASETDGEVDFRRIGDADYEVHIVSQRGASGNTIVAMPAKQVLELERTRRNGDIATHLIPEGMVVPNAIQPAGIGQNAWRVTDVFTSGPDYIEIEDPNGADNPIYFDDEFNANATPLIARTPHVVAIDGTLHEILDTETGPPARLYVADASAFSLNDHVTITKDVDGSHLPGLFDPAAVAQWGVIEGALSLPKLRGERNYGQNAEPRHWTPDGQAWASRSAGGSSGSSLPIDSLLPNQFIPDGTFVHRQSPGVGVQVTSGDVTANGAGEVTLTLVGSLTVSDNDLIYLFIPDSAPEDWTVLRPDISPLWRTSRSQTAILGDVDGNQTATLYLAVKNLTPGQFVPRGWEVNGTKIIQETIADGSGDAILHLYQPMTVSDDDPLTIEGIFMGSDAGDENRVVAMGVGMPSQVSGFTSLPVAILPIGQPVHAQAWFTSEIDTWGIADPTYRAPRLLLIAGTGTGANVTDADRLSEPVPFDFRLRCSAQAPSIVTTWHVQVIPPQYQLSPLPHTVTSAFYCRGFMVHIGEDPDAPFVFGSHANAGWHTTHRQLSRFGQPQQSFVVSMRDLSALAVEGYIASHNVITLGANLRIVSERFGVDLTRRILAYVVDLVTPENTGIILEDIGPEFSRLIVELRRQQEAA